jgi:hypothetical protein
MRLWGICLLVAASAAAADPRAVPGEAWMTRLAPVVGNLTLLDLALPGTHDTLTQDLSATVADNANDLPSWAAWLLHTFRAVDGFVGRFIRANAQTQTLNVTAQLRAGARFLDLRTTFTSPPDSALGAKDWYSLHMVESNKKFMAYVNATAEFLRDHPGEVVALFLTRHGCQACTGDKQYPGATNAEKQHLWAQIKMAFDGAGVGLVPTTTSVNSTSINTLVRRNQRVVIYAGDWVNFTGSDPLAWDAARYMFNGAAGGDVQNMVSSFAGWDKFYRNNHAQRAQLKASNTFFLMSLAGSPPTQVVQYAAEIAAAASVGLHPKSLLEKCAAVANIPNLSSYCPATLAEWERLRNFYSQVFMDRIAQDEFKNVYSPPGAIYMDMLGAHGEVKTSPPGDDAGAHAGFAYVDTMLLWNVRRACGGSGAGGRVGGLSPSAEACASAEAQLVTQRQAYPMTRWDDFNTGRHKNWPAL